MNEIYISTDVETDGPIPGPHSMLSLGSAAYTADKILVSTFSANLETLPGASTSEDSRMVGQATGSLGSVSQGSGVARAGNDTVRNLRAATRRGDLSIHVASTAKCVNSSRKFPSAIVASRSTGLIWMPGRTSIRAATGVPRLNP